MKINMKSINQIVGTKDHAALTITIINAPIIIVPTMIVPVITVPIVVI